LKLRYHALLIDLDGTIYHGDKPIEGAAELIAYLRKQEWSYRFVTNNSSATPMQVAERLNNMGIDAEPDDVCTSAQATAYYIKQHMPKARVMMIGEYGLQQALLEQGITITDEQPDIVVQGIDRSFTYEKAIKAVQAIRDGAISIMTNPDLLLPANGGFIPGAGSIGAMLKAASGKEPVIIGKPSRILIQYALDKLNCAAEQALVVGDNMLTDIRSGVEAGCDTVLLYTGLTTPANVEEYRKLAECEPTYCYTDLYELKQALMS